MRLVETILTRDKNWVQWKAENCLSFEKKPVPEVEVKRSLDRVMEICRPTRPYPHAMGAPALAKLWREAGKSPGMEGLKRKERWVHSILFPLAKAFDVIILSRLSFCCVVCLVIFLVLYCMSGISFW